MQIIKQDWLFEEDVNGHKICEKLERAGRTCYKSEGKGGTWEATVKFLKGAIEKGHHSILEHHNITVRIITDRGVTHELVRHRIAAYSQESTRYCRYDGSREDLTIKFIKPVDFELDEADTEVLFLIEDHYNWCLRNGRSPQQARFFLPNGLKTEIVATYNIREWRHIFDLRCSKAAHPQIRALMLDMLRGFARVIPILFDDLVDKYLINGEDARE